MTPQLEADAADGIAKVTSIRRPPSTAARLVDETVNIIGSFGESSAKSRVSAL
jgi:hypothetical protein